MVDEAIQNGAVVVQDYVPPPATVFGTDDPVAIAQRTTAIASALGSAIRAGDMMSQISGRNYVLMEGWSYLGAMLGVSPKTRDVEPLRDDGGAVFGFTATVDLITKGGETVGGATAICTRDENNWANRDSYALMSMAQTRAAGKAFRMTFGFVMKAAGYEATPAEEVGGESAAPTRSDDDEERLQALGAALNEQGLSRADLAPVLNVKVVRQATILNWLEDHDNDINALVEAVKRSVSERIAEGGDV